MAKNKDKNDSLDVVEVEHPEHDADAAFLKQQNEALLHLMATGVNYLGYIDPTRDQEPDIAPEKGVAPHPADFNPAPPRTSFSGRALDPEAVPMVQDADEKEESRKEATERFNEQLQAREELFQATKDTVYEAPVQRVVVVEEEKPAEVKDVPPVADESVKTVEGDPSKQLSNAADGYLEAEGLVEKADESKSDDGK